MWLGSREESCFLSETELWRRKKRFLLSWEQLNTFSCEARRKSAKRGQTKQIKDTRNKYTVHNQEYSHCWASKVTEKENSFLTSILGVQNNMSGSEEWRSWDENLRSKLRFGRVLALLCFGLSLVYFPWLNVQYAESSFVVGKHQEYSWTEAHLPA